MIINQKISGQQSVNKLYTHAFFNAYQDVTKLDLPFKLRSLPDLALQQQHETELSEEVRKIDVYQSPKPFRKKQFDYRKRPTHSAHFFDGKPALKVANIHTTSSGSKVGLFINCEGDIYVIKSMKNTEPVGNDASFENEHSINQLMYGEKLTGIYSQRRYCTYTRDGYRKKTWLKMPWFVGVTMARLKDGGLGLITVYDVLSASIMLSLQLAKLHNNNIVHKDIHLLNIVLWRDKDGVLKAQLIDFGISIKLSNTNPFSFSLLLNMDRTVFFGHLISLLNAVVRTEENALLYDELNMIFNPTEYNLPQLTERLYELQNSTSAPIMRG